MVAVCKDLHDFIFGVSTEERTGVVARHAEAGLREVVRAEAEEFGGERTARNLNHRADGVRNFYFLFLLHERGTSWTMPKKSSR